MVYYRCFQRPGLKTPAEFADQLAIHVNHLNRNVKSGKTTSQVIAERIAQEASCSFKAYKLECNGNFLVPGL